MHFDRTADAAITVSVNDTLVQSCITWRDPLDTDARASVESRKKGVAGRSHPADARVFGWCSKVHGTYDASFLPLCKILHRRGVRDPRIDLIANATTYRYLFFFLLNSLTPHGELGEGFVRTVRTCVLATVART